MHVTLKLSINPRDVEKKVEHCSAQCIKAITDIKIKSVKGSPLKQNTKTSFALTIQCEAYCNLFADLFILFIRVVRFTFLSFIFIHTDKSRIYRSVFKRGLFVAVLLFKII